MIECKHKITAFPSPPRKSAFRYKEVAEEEGLRRVRIGNLHLL